MRGKSGAGIVQQAGLIGTLLVLAICGYYGHRRWVTYQFHEAAKRDESKSRPRLERLLQGATAPSFTIAGKTTLFSDPRYQFYVFGEGKDWGETIRCTVTPREGSRIEVLSFMVCTPGTRGGSKLDSKCSVTEYRFVLDEVKVMKGRDPILAKLFLVTRTAELELSQLANPKAVEKELGDPQLVERLFRNVRSVRVRVAKRVLGSKTTDIVLTIFLAEPYPGTKQSIPIALKQTLFMHVRFAKKRS